MSGNAQQRQPGRTFIEGARRAQVVASAIEVIAEHGYAGATMARIAERAGISRSLINYHFTGREDLIGQVVLEVLGRGAMAIAPRVEAERSAPAQLTAYISSNLEFIATHRHEIIALVRIIASADTSEGLPGVPEDAGEQGLDYLRRILRDGQEAGDFAVFDTRQMAIAIRSVVDGVSTQLAADPDLDVTAATHEITTLFHRATRNDGDRP